jgi:hypothetical protein
MGSIVRFIEKRLRLLVNHAKSAVAHPEERHFVGFRLRRNVETGEAEVLLSKRSVDRLKINICKLTPRAWGQSFADCIERINVYLRGWMGFFGVVSESTETHRVFENADGHLRRRLRALLLRQWKRKRFIVRRLIRLGVRSHMAWQSVYKGRRSLWALSHCQAVDTALNKRFFRKHGLMSLTALYRDMHQPVVVPDQLELNWDSCGRKRRRRNTGLSSRTRRPEEPDVRSTSPVL